jgi:apocytochrome f
MQVSPAGDPVGLNVGGVVVLPEGFGTASAADSNIFTPFSASEAHSYVFGPVPASDYATTVLAVEVPADALSLSYPIVVAGNRGRGQLYPDGSPSNNGGFRSSCNGWTSRVHISREGTSLACWTRQGTTLLNRLPAGVDLLSRRSSQLGSRLSIDTNLASNPNVGGVGQSEVLIVLQSRQRLGYYVQVVIAIAVTQLALVLKKKQYERFRLGLDAGGVRIS